MQLLEDPYFLTIEEVADLTVRQITFLYYRERTKEGKAKTLPYYFKSEADKREEKIGMFKAFGKQLGKTDEEIEKMIDTAIKAGNL